MKPLIKTNTMAALFLISTLLVLAVSFYANFKLKRSDEIVRIATQDKLLSSALAAAQYVSVKELESYKNEKEPFSKGYLDLRDRMVSFGKAHNLLFVYYIYDNGDGDVYFIVDNDTDVEAQYTPDYHVKYDQLEKATKNALKGNADVSEFGKHDTYSGWNNLLSAFAPMYDEDGNVAFVAAVDIVDDYLIEMHKASVVLTLVQTSAVIISLLCGFFAIFIYSKKSKEAMAASAAKGRFLSQMSHEMRTPMNAIIGMATLAQKHLKKESEVKPYIDNIVNASDHLLGIINNILDMSKIEATNLVLDKKPFGVADALNEVSVILLNRFNEKNLALITDTKEMDGIIILSDKMRLKQVIINLLGNAVKFTPENGTVTLSAKLIEQTDKTVTIKFSVLDTGIGLKADQKARIFKAFEQADSTTAANFGGTGLGLPISQYIVNKMGSVIDLKSELGKGSDFYFTVVFDRASAETEEIKEEGAGVPDLSGRRIAIVDDVELNRDIVAEFIKDTGADYEQAADGKEIVEKFASSDIGYFDLILMDILMPELNGYEATKQIRQLDRADAKSVKIIALSANAFLEDIKASLDSGMDGHISKPIHINELYGVLGQNIG